MSLDGRPLTDDTPYLDPDRYIARRTVADPLPPVEPSSLKGNYWMTTVIHVGALADRYARGWLDVHPLRGVMTTQDESGTIHCSLEQ
jgi:hypothetical protein